MGDKSKRDPRDAPVESEGMGGAGGGDIDDVGDVGYPRDAVGRDATTGGGISEGMGGAGGGDIDDIGDVGHDVVRGDTGIVTGITTGVDTGDATEDPGAPWGNLDDELLDNIARGADAPSS